MLSKPKMTENPYSLVQSCYGNIAKTPPSVTSRRKPPRPLATTSMI